MPGVYTPLALTIMLYSCWCQSFCCALLSLHVFQERNSKHLFGLGRRLSQRLLRRSPPRLSGPSSLPAPPPVPPCSGVRVVPGAGVGCSGEGHLLLLPGAGGAAHHAAQHHVLRLLLRHLVPVVGQLRQRVLSAVWIVSGAGSKTDV